MRVLVCGSRNFNNRHLMSDVLHEYDITTIIEGEARGADTLARMFGQTAGIPVEKYPANWDKYGKAAGPIRNKQMLDEGKPDLVIAFMYPNSRGTANMVEQAKKAGIETRVVECT